MNGQGTLEIFPAHAPEEKPEAKIYGGLCLLAAEIGAKLDNAIAEDHDPWDHSKSNWASEIGHPCALNLTFKRTRWKEERRMDLDGLWRVKEGQDQEKRTRALLDGVGFTLVKAQTRVELADILVTGKIDGMIETPAKYQRFFEGIREIPVEVKSINPIYWDGTRTIWDIKNHPKFWIRKHTTQLNIYLVGHRLPGGLLILKTFGRRPRIMPMVFDPDLFARDKAMAEAVNRHVAAGTFPAPIPYEPDTCSMCGFNAICRPIRTSEFIALEQSETVLLEYYLELQDAAKKAKKDFDEIKEKLVGDDEKPGKYYGQNGIINDIEIQTKITKKKKIDLTPAAEAEIEKIEEAFAKKKETKSTSIKRTGPQKERRRNMAKAMSEKADREFSAGLKQGFGSIDEFKKEAENLGLKIEDPK